MNSQILYQKYSIMGAEMRYAIDAVVLVWHAR